MENTIEKCTKDHEGLEYYGFFSNGLIDMLPIDWNVLDKDMTPHLVDEHEGTTSSYCAVMGCETFMHVNNKQVILDKSLFKKWDNIIPPHVAKSPDEMDQQEALGAQGDFCTVCSDIIIGLPCLNQKCPW